MTAELPLIAGAGPVGLAAALLLSRKGIAARLIDSASERPPFSRALAVNPRTLELLESTGVTKQILELGRQVQGARFWSGGRIVGEVNFETLHHNYPFLIALSQATTEKLLANALSQAGVSVERGSSLLDCVATESGSVQARVQTSTGVIETINPPWLLAADGAHSVARKSLGIAFDGDTFEIEWHLIDVPLRVKAVELSEQFAHIIFLDGGGFLFLLRVIDEHESTRTGDPVWRIMGDVPNVLERLSLADATGPAIWSSKFRIAHRVADRLQSGNVFLAGDSAHLHSPVGARGMNLGIEDAWTFAEFAASGRLDQYGKTRRTIDRRVVKRIEMITRIARGESVSARAMRSTLIPMLTRIPPARNQMIRTVTGLDHSIEDILNLQR